ncbi:Putative HTH-type transcriptional regulator IscR [Candidatus Fokinia solitaria]|uniref:HTH-type transcriptional regulator IscR n=1 Tax=Candidatus Fokinia solitaria TaxID=1802984 RepID=A0A2U8BSF1_9RICK|nr:Rrf2 family transcriptional regulator [Candidatus Fokinia solitaria]AWD33271.1 Putative HTH-type transcriptional regulator IscR [Candidatus Fokinia solitaria]
MFITTRTQYAVIALLELQNNEGRYITLSSIANKHSIELSYLEVICAKLRRNGILKAAKGPGGGYSLVKPANQISLLSVLTAAGEKIKLTRCKGKHGCMKNNQKCETHELWTSMERHIKDYLHSINLPSLKSGSGCNFMRRIISQYSNDIP